MSFIEYYENRHIIPTKIEWKEEIYQDLLVLEQSMVSIDGLFQLSTAFLQEAVKMIVNAIVLFEQGYYDSAYYSIRQSLEIAVSIVFFASKNEDQRNKILTKWKQKESNLMYARMLKEMGDKVTLVSDVIIKMQHLIDDTKILKKKLDKEIHKEGLSTFYVVRNHVTNQFFKNENDNEEFKKIVIGSIKGLTLFRICLDPLPILLRDTEIYSRTPVFMTDSFPEYFINKYLTAYDIKMYQSTQIYQDAYIQFINNVKMNSSTVSFIKDSYVDYKCIDVILNQKDLLSDTQIAVLQLLEKFHCVTRLYPDGQMLEMYFTSLKSSNPTWGFSDENELFDDILRNKEFLNVLSNNVYISSFFFKKRYFVIEHLKMIKNKHLD